MGLLDYDQFGMLGVRMALTVVAKNDNRVAAAGFSDVGFTLSFHQIDVCTPPRSRSRTNCSWPLQYDMQAAPILLDADAMQAMDAMKEEE